MNQQAKQQVQAALKLYVGRYESQAKAVATLRGVSEATAINILKGKWDSISAEMWRKVGKQVGYNSTWNIVPTRDFNTLISYFTDAKEYANVYGIVGNAGGSKTSAAEYMAANHINVFHLECSEYWNRKTFLSKLLKRMGRDNTGYSIGEMVECITDIVNKADEPLIILDEVDKLSDSVFYFFISFCNMMKEKCGIAIMATDYLKKRIERGVNRNQKGYNEIFSRIGRRFIGLKGVSANEVRKICTGNGLDDEATIIEIQNTCDGDLRRVKRAIHKHRKQQDNREDQKAA